MKNTIQIDSVREIQTFDVYDGLNLIAEDQPFARARVEYLKAQGHVVTYGMRGEHNRIDLSPMGALWGAK